MNQFEKGFWLGLTHLSHVFLINTIRADWFLQYLKWVSIRIHYDKKHGDWWVELAGIYLYYIGVWYYQYNNRWIRSWTGRKIGPLISLQVIHWMMAWYRINLSPPKMTPLVYQASSHPSRKLKHSWRMNNPMILG